jgi:hypothetical protein
MKTYTGTVVLRLYHEVTVQVPDEADRDEIEQEMFEYYDLNNCRDHPEHTDAELLDLEEITA